MKRIHKQSDMSIQGAAPIPQRQRVLWIVERPCSAEFLSLCFAHQTGFTVRTFSPTGVLVALKDKEQLPDILVTAFYFDGGPISGLRIVQELRKVAPTIPAIVISGFPLEHLRGAVADWPAQPDYLLQKGIESFHRDLLSAIEEVHTCPSLHHTKQIRLSCDPVALPARAATSRLNQQSEQVAGRAAVVYLVGDSNCLGILRAYAEEMASTRFKRPCDYLSFTDPAIAWSSLDQPGIKPDGLVTDYYISGGFINGLKLIKHAQTLDYQIWTILVGYRYSGFHLQAAMDATGISPDLFFHE
ncbi:MAG TPA: hypothetical protein VKY92_24335 [Verrucomicrobiae bacterium]|nr:hypothetical protein [Verrucomicrobiae bacterium]